MKKSCALWKTVTCENQDVMEAIEESFLALLRVDDRRDLVNGRGRFIESDHAARTNGEAVCVDGYGSAVAFRTNHGEHGGLLAVAVDDAIERGASAAQIKKVFYPAQVSAVRWLQEDRK